MHLKKDLKKQSKDMNQIRTDFIKITQNWKVQFGANY